MEFTVHREIRRRLESRRYRRREDLSILLERWGVGVGGREIAHLLGVWGHQVSYAPEVITVNEMTLNPRTTSWSIGCS